MKKNLNTKQCKTKLKQIKTLLSEEDKNLITHLKANFFKHYQIAFSNPRILKSKSIEYRVSFQRVSIFKSAYFDFFSFYILSKEHEN